MKVSEVMTQKMIVVSRSTSLSELIKLFRSFHSFPLVPVVDENNVLVGIVSFQRVIDAFTTTTPDIIKTVSYIDEQPLDIFDMDITPEIGELCIVDDFMDTKFVSVNKDTLIEEAYRLMQVHKCEHMPVVDSKNKLIGRIGIFDILLTLFKEKGLI